MTACSGAETGAVRKVPTSKALEAGVCRSVGVLSHVENRVQMFQFQLRELLEAGNFSSRPGFPS